MIKEQNTLLIRADYLLREEDMMECVEAVFGKTLSAVAAFSMGCCVEAYALCVLWKDPNFVAFPWRVTAITTLCLLAILCLQYVVPHLLRKWLFHNTTAKYHTACFYAKHFELWNEAGRIRTCPYGKVKRVIFSERLLILVFPGSLACIAIDCFPDSDLSDIREHIRRSLT